MNYIFSLTTIPTRLSYDGGISVHKCLDSLLNQNTSLSYEIHFNIPDRIRSTHPATKEITYEIPEWLVQLSENNPKLKLFTNLNDLGPITKLYYTVERVKNPEDIIVVVDDDIIYDKDLLSEHIKNQEKYLNSLVGYDGMDVLNKTYNDWRDQHCIGVKRDEKVKYLKHWRSVSYKRRYFEDDFFQFVNDHLCWDDDIIVGGYMATKRRDRIVTFHPRDREYIDFMDWKNYAFMSFPFIDHAQRKTYDGCDVFRQDEDTFMQKKSSVIFEKLKKYMDEGYA